MKKNFFKGFALALGLVAFFNVNTFAQSNTFDYKSAITIKTQLVEKKTCKFSGRYKLSDKDLKVLQENFKDVKKEIMTDILSSQENPPFDMNIDKVMLTIQKDGNGKLSTLWSFNICPENDNFDAYGKFCLAFNISQKNENTFLFHFPDESNEGSLKLFKKRINGKKCLILKDSSLGDLVFEKIK